MKLMLPVMRSEPDGRTGGRSKAGVLKELWSLLEFCKNLGILPSHCANFALKSIKANRID
ncbi:MAG: hypothetical protein E3K37_11515 [Candidatus Kuenenia sp.]|nr:hypothetical protein [Candidatus Kuenenia hertensis]